MQIEGYIYPSQKPGTIPLKQYWHSGRGDNIAVATREGERAVKASGYELVGLLGYIHPWRDG